MKIFRSRPARRRALLAAAVAAAVAAGVGVVSGMSPATARQDPAQATFRCALPDGGQVDTPVQVGLSVPETVTAGEPLAAEPTVEIALPADAVAALRAVGAETIGGSATAEFALRQNGVDTPLPPAELAAAPSALAEGVILALSGPAVTAEPEEGTAELVLAGLTAHLRAGAPGKADQAVDCDAYPGGETLGSAAVTAAPAQRRQPVAPMDEPSANAGLKVTFDVNAVNTIAKIGVDLSITGDLVTFLDPFAPPPSPVTGTLTLDPVKDAYLVVFRFMPVHNDIEFKPGAVTGTAEMDITGQPWKAKVDTVSDIELRLHRVRQDGVDLAVGDNCWTAGPMKVPLKGDIILVPGATSEFKTKADLPAFTGCGTREDLDPLITGLVSGPDNPMTVRLTLKCIETNCG
ncbi:DUF6801 domain-containing protein [Actinokineospora fastidiosa]|uniref:DUF6801 domain-containing protein n=1 Tax=Actinokineospora fastidiosa TaxID=1816 RepID=A0A918GN50_9PSEU|nr:DUF6801 domain-containing protein [Actinokineospora fastidiosa]GGS48098.1 hypothetical protein GCM10010171_49170 [Actinokineospora fastidiosa]